MRNPSGLYMVSTNRDRRFSPLYTAREAAEYLGIPVSTIRAWAFGRAKPAAEPGRYSPVLQFVDQESRLFSFYDLVEAHILRAAIDRHLPIARIKKGLAYLRESNPDNPRPLLTYDFLTDGKHLLIGGMLESTEHDRNALVNASRDGQLEMTPIVERYLELIVRGKDQMPVTLFPQKGGHVISMDISVVSGRPVVEGTRITTSVIAQRAKAGEFPEDLARDYKLPLEKIEAAITFETAA